MKILISSILIVCFSIAVTAQDSTLTLLFMGDIMGHDSQITSARQTDGSYDYNPVFEYLSPLISETDVAIANLEVTLAGPPFKGYPQFSSPDALGLALKNAGIHYLVTANNHSVDRGKKGLERTLDQLDSLGIQHTGTFRSPAEKTKQPFLWIEQKGFRLALINYTYGTNGIPVHPDNHVNLIHRDSLSNDIAKAKAAKPDKVIVLLHWGNEYQRQPNKNQIDLASHCFNAGADIIIGSHPHVIQKSEWYSDNLNNNESFITYSLGNFISNQRKQFTDGGQMIKLTLQRDTNNCYISESGYLLTWVYTPVVDQKKHFYILPCAEYELKPEFFVSPEHFEKMKLFIADSRNLLNTNNHKVSEYLFYENQWINR
ncbi:MAG: CapA family protein [Salinivirgaceae bacterium]